MKNQLDRRNFLKKGAKAGLGIALGNIALNLEAGELLPTLETYPFNPGKLEKIRIGMVGVGGMGTSHLSNFLKIEVLLCCCWINGLTDTD